MPATSLEEIREWQDIYRMAGFPGCIGSTDASQIPLDKVSLSIWQNLLLSFIAAATTWAYNLKVNHNCKDLHNTIGHPGRWNDTTLARFNHFLDELLCGSFDERMTLALLDKHGKAFKMKGAGAYVLFWYWLRTMVNNSSAFRGIVRQRGASFFTMVRVIAQQCWMYIRHFEESMKNPGNGGKNAYHLDCRQLVAYILCPAKHATEYWRIKARVAE
jgi:hypothetical protein